MLAEARRRSKYSVDPNGLNWSKDTDKFGQKMLEKMGWQEGKGLGAKENGMLDHVAVKHKLDSKGVGCSRSHADNWIAHQDDFNALLSSLQEGSEEPAADTHSVSSLEHKSKHSKARVHYMKFTKGKDLSSKNREDLDCVFGRRKSKTVLPAPEEAVSCEGSDDTGQEEESPTDSSHGVVTVTNSLSAAEYFARKMEAMKGRLSKGEQQCADGGQQSQAEEAGASSEECTQQSASRHSSDRDSQAHCNGGQSLPNATKKKKRKKDKENECLVLEESVTENNCKPSKRQKDKKARSEQAPVEPSDSGQGEANVTVCESTGNTSGHNTEGTDQRAKRKKKSKKRKRVEEGDEKVEVGFAGSNLGAITGYGQPAPRTTDTPKRKKKKKSKKQVSC